MSLFISTEITLQGGQKATVYYLTEEGKRKFEVLLSNIGWTEKRIDTAFERINKLEDELIRNFFLEKMQVHIVESLRDGPKTQREIMKPLPDWTKNRLLYHAFYEAWKQFEKHGVIQPISHGRGHPRTWQLYLTAVEVQRRLS